MHRKLTYVDLDRAFHALLHKIHVEPQVELVPLAQAYGRVLAEPFISPVDLPPRDSSHVDGYAVRARDTQGTSKRHPVRLDVVGRAGPAEAPARQLSRGEAYRVLTGGYLPEGADAMVPQEDTVPDDHSIEVARPVPEGEFVVPQGSDFRKGEVVFRRGHVLRAQDLSTLGALRRFEVKVFRKPVVSIIPVGTELVDRPEDVAPGKVFNGHALTVARLVEAAGAVPLIMKIVPDERGALAESLRNASAQSDLLLTVGGSSVSEIDLVAEALGSVQGSEIVAHGLKVQPGRVAGFGLAGGKPIVLLPGLIQSTINAYVFIAYPLIRLLLGLPPRRDAFALAATLASDLHFARYVSFDKVTWVRLLPSRRGLLAHPVLGDSSHLSVVSRADGYIVTPANQAHVGRGTPVEVKTVPGISYVHGPGAMWTAR